MNRINKHVDYLKILSKCKPNMRKSIIQNADKELVNTLCECILSCINGNISINSDTKQKLKRNKNILRKLLVKKKSSLNKKKQLLIQKGGSFIPILLSTILSGLTGL